MQQWQTTNATYFTLKLKSKQEEQFLQMNQNHNCPWLGYIGNINQSRRNIETTISKKYNPTTLDYLIDHWLIIRNQGMVLSIE